MGYFADQMVLMAQEGAQIAADRQADAAARRASKREAALAEKARFEENAVGYEMADEAARQSAIRDALLVELRRVDPTNKLLNRDLRRQIGQAGISEFVRHGRASVTDADVVSAGKVRV